MLNNREWALAFWACVILLLFFARKQGRAGLRQIGHAAWKPRILGAAGALSSYIGLEAWLGSKVGIWRSQLLKDTIVWSMFVGFVMLVNLDQVSDSQYFRKKIAGVFGITTLLEFFTNLFVMNLAVEILLQPLLAFLAIMSVVAARDERTWIVKKLADSLLTVAGLVFLGFSVKHLISSWDELDQTGLLRQLLLPSWMTIALLPFIYALSLYSNYELAFNGVDWATKDVRSRRRAKLAIVSKFHVKNREVHRFNWTWVQRTTATRSLAAARQEIDKFRGAYRRKQKSVVQ